MTPPENSIALLEQEIKASIDEYQYLKKLNQKIGLGLGISGIVFSFLATVAGIVGTPNAAKLAAGFAAASGALQGALFAYPVDKRSSFYRVLEAKGKNLASDLKIRQGWQTTDQYLENLLEQLKILRMEAAIEPDSDQKQREENGENEQMNLGSESQSEPDGHTASREAFVG